MGNVAVIAAGYLVQKLNMVQVAELPSNGHFDVHEVEVRSGVVAPARLPRGVFFETSNPRGRNLIVFMGEAQPTTGTFDYARELITKAQEMGVERVVTFASMASGLHPSENPKVVGVANDPAMVAELQRAEVEPMGEGHIGGLNGVLLAAAADRGVPGLSLLAEIPFFAAAVPNPKAARAALSVFSVLANINISLKELNKHAVAVDRALIDALEQMERRKARGASADQDETGDDDSQRGEAAGDRAGAEPQAAQPASDPRPPAFQKHSRIERLFEEAKKDPARALPLKDELDRLRVFKRYEDRFLDLFRRAG